MGEYDRICAREDCRENRISLNAAEEECLRLRDEVKRLKRVAEAADLVSEGWPEKWGMANDADRSVFRNVPVNILAVQELREALQALDDWGREK